MANGTDLILPMAFDRFGKTLHLRIAGTEDLKRVLELNEAHWVATSAPVPIFRSDPVFLQWMDRNTDGRIGVSDVRAAVRWFLRRIPDGGGFSERSRELILSTLYTGDEEGKRIERTIRKILCRLKMENSETISLEQVRKARTLLENMPVSEAGVVLPGAAEDPKIQEFLAAVLRTVGGAPHPGGGTGVGAAALEEFVAQARAFIEWEERLRSEDASEMLPLGAVTPRAFQVYATLQDKIEEYFSQCRAIALNEKYREKLPPGPERISATDFTSPAEIESLMQTAPLSRPRADRTLDLREETNPFYAPALGEIRSRVIEPILGAESERLTEAGWERIRKVFASYESWLAAKPETSVEALGPDLLREYLKDEYAYAVKDLIARSGKDSLQLDDVKLVEKLALYQTLLLDFLNNFVSFPHLYDPEKRAMFEMGTLIMDGRRFNFAVRVTDRAEHATVSANGKIFVLYLQISGRNDASSFEIAVPVTSGRRGNLFVGKRGIFQDVDGREWDARVVQIIENSISLGEALWVPFKRIGTLVTGKIEQITAAAGTKLEVQTQATLEGVQTGQPAPPRSSEETHGGGLNRTMMAGGLLAGGGVALAAIGSALAYISKVVSEAGPGVLFGGLGAALLAVLLPTGILAWIRLRQRDLSSLLEGSGWAINARMRLNRKQGRFFTQRPGYLGIGKKGPGAVSTQPPPTPPC